MVASIVAHAMHDPVGTTAARQMFRDRYLPEPEFHYTWLALNGAQARSARQNGRPA